MRMNQGYSTAGSKPVLHIGTGISGRPSSAVLHCIVVLLTCVPGLSGIECGGGGNDTSGLTRAPPEGFLCFGSRTTGCYA